MNTVLIILAVLVGIFFLLHRSGNPAFWRLVRKRPDLAMAWFQSEDCWIIVRPGEPAPSRDSYTVGFSVYDPASDEWVKVHCLPHRIDDSQARFLAEYGPQSS